MSNVEKLPDSYVKSKQSNNYKLLNINEQAIADIKADAQAVLDALEIQNATGKTLDLYGDMLGQQRGALNDEQYRYMILTRMGINIVQGDYRTIMDALIQIFDCKARDIVLKDGAGICQVEINQFPLEILVNAGFSSNQAVEIIEMLLPIGTTIVDVNFEGTFEFSDVADEYDELAGFGNIEQTIGGYLGLSLGDDAPILPI